VGPFRGAVFGPRLFYSVNRPFSCIMAGPGNTSLWERILKNYNNIFLVGPMGAGKTTIGRKLAKKLKLEFFDSDEEIERRTQADVALIFEIEGESGFRKREAEMIDELTKYSDIVLATGGGAVLNEQNRINISERGWVVYLKASIRQILRRTARDSRRPLLITDNRKQKIEELLRERGPLYEEVADMIIDTGNKTVKQIISEICDNKVSR